MVLARFPAIGCGVILVVAMLTRFPRAHQQPESDIVAAWRKKDTGSYRVTSSEVSGLEPPTSAVCSGSASGIR